MKTLAQEIAQELHLLQFQADMADRRFKLEENYISLNCIRILRESGIENYHENYCKIDDILREFFREKFARIQKRPF
jgi:hypothetical protein